MEAATGQDGNLASQLWTAMQFREVWQDRTRLSGVQPLAWAIGRIRVSAAFPAGWPPSSQAV